ncbi:Elongation factor Tu domain 2 protein [Nitrosotalea sinensis]|uniref:Elongation factor Tu domain 2 protein n=1 Tax=Nitrosotalea sinensis TaxID=1499975 RepID=A0A2H1EHB0_9ARCH|nr:EF-Tu/IF-2/RF-3 family GTPase [Candidatus Nitrosotalea sinensis]SHO46315.1 Elongation factor Tu domain 2 protein [Candidatus Nitrosotalea sinensis]
MKSVNFTLLADESIAKDFGKKGTTTDITIYDKKESGVLRTWTLPTSFPDKIQSLLQAINMGEYVILHVAKLDKFTGEQIIALDVLGKEKGILSHSFDVDRNTLLSMIKGTVVEKYALVEPENLKKEIDLLEPISRDGPAQIVVDHCFDVKGVGTVILGKLSKGTIKVYENLKIFPKGSDVVVKSIQMHDDSVENASSPARVGLAVKGVTPDDVQRGDVLCMPDVVQISQEIEIDYVQSKFFKDKISENQMFLVNIGLQIRPVKIVSLTPVKLSLGKPIVYEKGDICVILKPESTSIRIVGSGKITK